MKTVVPKFIVALAVFLSACNIYTDVTVNMPPKTDLTRYQTFAWLPDARDTNNSPYNNEIIRNNIRNCIGKSFTDRGYVLQLDTPDILLQVVITNTPKTKEVIYPVYPPAFYYSRYYFGSDYYSPYPQNYYYKSSRTLYCSPLGYCAEEIDFMEGSITLNVIDREKALLVWSCTAKGDIYDPAYINRSIHPAIISIMKKYPVKSVIKHQDSREIKPVLTAK
jgi:hypothetical protein